MGAAGRCDSVTAMVVDRGALFLPYALAWVSHFFIEHNRPASFEHPLWSWWATSEWLHSCSPEK